jgi:hypothetical protein
MYTVQGYPDEPGAPLRIAREADTMDEARAEARSMGGLYEHIDIEIVDGAGEVVEYMTPDGFCPP